MESFTPIPIGPDPNRNLIYSNILDKHVLDCCYQSARLNDKYCVCGRALEYLTEAEKFSKL